MRAKTVDILCTGLTVAVPAAAILGLLFLVPIVTGWIASHVAGPVIAGIRGTLLMPGSL